MSFATYWLSSSVRAATVFVSIAVSGCAASGSSPAPGDPLEHFNRGTYAFNKGVDDNLLIPIAQGYQAVTPLFVDLAVTNFFRNLGDITNAVNNVLQLKLTDAVEDAGRLALNTTFGLGGVIDFASGIGIDRHNEDFGQTLGYWGLDTGPYLVLPLLGPSTVRDTVGRGVDSAFFDPVTQIGGHDALEYGLKAINVVDTRADLLGASAVLGVATWDEYSFVRDAYLQRRGNLVRDGALAPE